LIEADQKTYRKKMPLKGHFFVSSRLSPRTSYL
jgi:hypothetical protein